jgi:hypothetical protein
MNSPSAEISRERAAAVMALRPFPELTEHVRGYEIDWPAVRAAAHSGLETAMVDVAWALFSGDGDVLLGRIANHGDEFVYRAFLDALAIYRGDLDPPPA